MKSLWKKKIQAIEADARRENGSWSEIINFVKWSFIKSTYRFRAILMLKKRPRRKNNLKMYMNR